MPTTTPSQDSRLQGSSQVQYMYQNSPETTIYLTNVMVALPAAKAQFETQQHGFSPILEPNYNFSGTPRDLTRISLQLIYLLQSCPFVFPFYLFLSIQTSSRRYN